MERVRISKKELEEMSYDLDRIASVSGEMEKALMDVYGIALDDLEVMTSIPWDLAECAEQYRFSLAKIVERVHLFLEYKNSVYF